MKTDYGKILRARYEQAKLDCEEVIGISLTEYRARQGIEAWRTRMAEHLRITSTSDQMMIVSRASEKVFNAGGSA